ncbi:hypothetical protein [Pseudomonas sp. H9]|uniref:hypothetical protein n=1 Tax=Pseudomonas sp. H9 TaxID=483968 RepID=UPI001057B550|nr:hypothetical protein [Pseudomonas sp. H9]TDF85137.1 hypothetical protein E1573_05710 [Pseudomonas sp. H9]
MSTLNPAWITKTEFSEINGTLCPAEGNKILVFSEPNPNSNTFTLARLNSDGTLDPTFNGTGYIEHSFAYNGNPMFFPISAHQQSDGKIFMVGATGTIFDLYPVAARFLSNGAADESFGDKGFVEFKSLRWTNATDTLSSAELRSIPRQGSSVKALSASSLALGGYLIVSTEKGYLLRIKDDGSIYTGFGDKGYLRPKLANGDDIVTPTAIVLGERIFVAGSAGTSGAVACFTLTGAPDTSFGNEGARIISLADDRKVGLYALSSTDTTLLNLAGETSIGTDVAALLTRVTVEGNMDKRFNNGTPLVLRPDGRLADCRQVASPQSDKNETFYIVGQTNRQDLSDARFYAAAFRPDGTLDNRFTPDGWGLGPEHSLAVSMYVDTQGNMLICGSVLDAGNKRQGIVACYKLNAS